MCSEAHKIKSSRGLQSEMLWCLSWSASPSIYNVFLRRVWDILYHHTGLIKSIEYYLKAAAYRPALLQQLCWDCKTKTMRWLLIIAAWLHRLFCLLWSLLELDYSLISNSQKLKVGKTRLSFSSSHFWQVSGDCLIVFPFCFISHLLLAWERVVVTRHIGHDGLLIWPQGANDICPGNRGRGGEERTERRRRRRKKNAQE